MPIHAYHVFSIDYTSHTSRFLKWVEFDFDNIIRTSIHKVLTIKKEVCMTTQLKAISIALSGILLSACGGGSTNGDTGSEDTLPTQKNTLPNAIAG